MKRHKQKRKKAGAPPGSVVFTGQRKIEKILMHFMKYNAEELEEQDLDNLQLPDFDLQDETFVKWYDIRGLHDTELLQLSAQRLNLHPLVMEDVADVNQRPKLDEYPDHILIQMKALGWKDHKVTTEQVSMVLSQQVVFSFQEDGTDLFEKVRDRLINKSGRFRTRKADYLAYVLIDTAVDHYFFVLDALGEEIERLEEKILKEAPQEAKNEIFALKREVSTIRRGILPLREILLKFSKLEHPLIDKETAVFIRDVQDNLNQVIEMTESNREMLISLQELLISQIEFETNNVIQFLTIISAIFIPLSFLAGLYGMNFRNMPELDYPYSYFILLAVMIFIAGGLLFYFRKKKWL
jgi:magnesium transporter